MRLTSALVSVFLLAGTLSAQVTASLSTNQIASGDTLNVTVSGLTPNSSYKVYVVGVSGSGTETTTSRQVTTDELGNVTWAELIVWSEATYSTVVKFQLDGGHLNTVSSGDLSVS